MGTRLAQAFCGDLAVIAAEETSAVACRQLGIRTTWEFPAHLYLKPAKADQIALGAAGRHWARPAELVNLPAT